MNDAQRVVAWLDDWLAGGGRLLLSSDYDGTLTPIVPSPDQAALPEPVRRDLEALTACPQIDVAILSGRDVADLRALVGVKRAIYAGCHGLEIEGPGVSFSHPEAQAQEEMLEVIARHLMERAPTVPGMQVESK